MTSNRCTKENNHILSEKHVINTFAPDELAKIAGMLDMELAYVDKTVNIENGNKYVIAGITSWRIA